MLNVFKMDRKKDKKMKLKIKPFKFGKDNKDQQADSEFQDFSTADIQEEIMTANVSSSSIDPNEVENNRRLEVTSDTINRLTNKLNGYWHNKRLSEDDKTDVFLKVAAVLIVAWVLLGYGGHILTMFMAFTFPAYKSLKAILSESREDDLSCLRYWVVVSVLMLVDTMVELLLPSLPFYFILKFAFLLWCMAPIHNNGGDVVFQMVILPLFKKHEAQIDQYAEKAVQKATEMVNDACREMQKGLETADVDIKKLT